MTRRRPSSLSGKTAFVTGGSGGLGKEIAKLLVASGAHVTIFARRQAILDEARTEIFPLRLNDEQEVNAVSVDLGDAVRVNEVFRSQPRTPDILYCVAGGCQTQCGYLTDISAASLESCMKNNYFTAAYSAQTTLQIWTENEKQGENAKTFTHRRIIFINSAGAFLGLPGYTAYTTSKTATRALADTLRMEVLRHSNSFTKYTIQCAFPSNFITDAFFEEQNNKPQLTKAMEGTAGSELELKKKFPSAKKVAEYIVGKLDSADFAICDSSDSSILWANMIGPSPKRGLGIVDSLLALLVGLLIWPFQRRQWDAMCKKDAQ